MSEIVLEARNIVKRFPGVIALDNVSYDLRVGEVHGLLGQNGAGKSTLLKILSGIYRPDSGELYIYGRKTVFKKPADAREHGIVLVHQEITLMPHLTVLENISLLGFLWKRWGATFDKNSVRRYIEDIMSKYDIDLNLDSKVKDISVADKMLTQVVAALSTGARILLLDEPTSPLSPRETEVIFDAMRKLKQQGVSIAFVTHRVSEALEICDRITVLRNGVKVGTVLSRDVDVREVVKMMFGHEAEEVYMVRSLQEIDLIVEKMKSEKPFVELINITTRPRTAIEVPLRNVNLKIYRGEIVAVFGLIGAGKTELGKTLLGLTKVVDGEIRIEGRPVKIRSPTDAAKFGIMYIPEDRKSEGLIPHFIVASNMTISALKAFTKYLFVIDRQREASTCDDMVKKLNIVTPSIYTKITSLSGGNQQKVLISRLILARSRLAIFDEPTVGIDIETKAEIRKLIHRYSRDYGVSVLVLTSDIDEALGLADRIYVMKEGRVVGEFVNKDLNRDIILKSLFQGKAALS